MNEFEIQNSFEQELIDNGYKFFKDNWKNSLKGIQKKFTDENGVKYFITGYCYNIALQFPNVDAPNYNKYTFTVQFSYNKSTTDHVVDVSYSADFLDNEYRKIDTRENMETYFENIFIKTRAEYYEKY